MQPRTDSYDDEIEENVVGQTAAPRRTSDEDNVGASIPDSQYQVDRSEDKEPESDVVSDPNLRHANQVSTPEENG